MKKTALITGITGQDGSYLAEFLLKKNYDVVGLLRGKVHAQHKNIDHIRQEIKLFYADLNNTNELFHIIKEQQPDEIYNLASQSYPAQSWHESLNTLKINGFAAHALFDTVKKLKLDCRIYQASSSDMFGHVLETPQSENTPFNPVNPYAAAKVYAHHLANIYRRSYNMFISCGILFNHESKRRGIHFITQKVTYAAACIKLGIKNSQLLNENNFPIVNNGKLFLGNLHAERDWGYAGDYVEAMYLMLQQHQPDDFIIGTGKIRTIQQLCETAFSYLELDWKKYIEIDPALSRLAETGPTVANPDKAKKMLGWKASTSFNELIISMVDHHLENLSITPLSNR